MNRRKLYAWLKKYGSNAVEERTKVYEHAEISRLQRELRRVERQRDNIKQLLEIYGIETD